jgi:hypothetical protein
MDASLFLQDKTARSTVVRYIDENRSILLLPALRMGPRVRFCVCLLDGSHYVLFTDSRTRLITAAAANNTCLFLVAVGL